jgi:hypothetical protein
VREVRWRVYVEFVVAKLLKSSKIGRPTCSCTAAGDRMHPVPSMLRLRMTLVAEVLKRE